MNREFFPAGTTIFRQGESSRECYRIISGSVDVVVIGRDGGEHRVASLGPDEVFGEMGIIDPAPRSASVISREDTACEAFTDVEIIELMSREPERVMEFMTALILRLRSADRKLAQSAPPGPPKRPGGL